MVIEASEGVALEDDEVKHYDADGACTCGNVWATFSNTFALSFLTVSVLTKVVVYAGIGTVATVIVPAMFEALEWGV